MRGRGLHARLERLINTADATHSFVSLAGRIIATSTSGSDSPTSDLRVVYGFLEGSAQALVVDILKLEAETRQGGSDVLVERLARLWHNWLEVDDALGVVARYLGPFQVLAALFDSSGDSDDRLTAFPQLLPTIRQVRTLCLQRPGELGAALAEKTSPPPDLAVLIKDMERTVDLQAARETVAFIDGLTALRDGLALTGDVSGGEGVL
jgi:hypothetical protein